MYIGRQHGAAALNALDFYLAGVLSSHGAPPPGGGGMAEGELVMEGRGASGTGGGWGGLRTVQVCVCVYVYVCMRQTSHTSQFPSPSSPFTSPGWEGRSMAAVAWQLLVDYVCVCVCVCVLYIYTYVYIYIYVYIHLGIHV